MRGTVATKQRDHTAGTTLPGPRLFTVAEYHRMAEVGILKPQERVELIEGAIIRMAAMGTQVPVRLTEHSEPEPDLMLLRPPSARYREKTPTAADVLLLIEVSNKTLAYDRGTKLPLYAREGIPEVWIVNLKRNRIEVYRDPFEGSYRQTSVHERGGSVSPAAFPDLALSVSDVV